MTPFILFVTVVPLILALIGFFFGGRHALQIGLWLLLLLLCLTPALMDGFQQPGSTRLGTVVIVSVPFLFALLGMAMTNRPTSPAMRSLTAFGGNPALYWLGVLVGLSFAVTAGLASP